jgi:integrase
VVSDVDHSSSHGANEGRRKKLRKTFPTLSAAKAWRHDTVSALGKGTMRAPTRQTVQQNADEWIDGVERGSILNKRGQAYKPSAARTYVRDLRRYVLPALGTLRMSVLRRVDVQELVDDLVGNGLSASRIHGIVNSLRAVCRRALERDEIMANPCANVRLPAANGKRERAATPSEAAELLEPLPDDVREVYASAFYAGLRRGELRALRVNNLGLTDNVIDVRQAWDDVEGPIAPKSEKGVRKVPVPATLRLLLLEHLARTGRRGDDLVFGSSAAAPFTPTHIRKRALAAWGAANVERAERDLPPLVPITLHECRHTYVSLMHAAGCSLEEIGDYVGHSSAYMTDRYRHLLDGQRETAAAKLDALLAAPRA